MPVCDVSEDNPGRGLHPSSPETNHTLEVLLTRGISSAGRALRSHRRGQEFESPILHSLKHRQNNRFTGNQEVDLMYTLVGLR